MLGFLFALGAADLRGVDALGVTPLTRVYQGSSFFDRWNYWGTYDNTTHGDALYANRSYALSSRLTYTTPANTAIIKVDNSTTVPFDYKRDTIKIESIDTYDVGSVIVLDALHLPYGCSVWPAFWTYGRTGGVQWPDGGEIDIIEGTNNQFSGWSALHTTNGCSLTPSSSAYTGIVNQTTCYHAVNGNLGCGVTYATPKTYGAAFARGGGGVFVTELAVPGIAIWFFERANIPAAVSSAASFIDTRGLGTPSSFWSNENCDIKKYFSPQTLTFTITLCGDWAGHNLNITGCPALISPATCYTTYVLEPSNYNTAYFEINHIRVYSNASTAAAVSAPSPSRLASSGLRVGFSAAYPLIMLALVYWSVISSVEPL